MLMSSEYDTDEFPLHCTCGLRVKDMECFGQAKANSDYIIHRCRCGGMWIVDTVGGDAENAFLESPTGDYDVLTNDEQGYGMF